MSACGRMRRHLSGYVKRTLRTMPVQGDVSASAEPSLRTIVGQNEHGQMVRILQDDPDGNGTPAVRQSEAAAAGSAKIGMVVLPSELQMAVNHLIDCEPALEELEWALGPPSP